MFCSSTLRKEMRLLGVSLGQRLSLTIRALLIRMDRGFIAVDPPPIQILVSCLDFSMLNITNGLSQIYKAI